MHLIALCPTYGRPSLAANALAIFLAQQLSDEHSAHLLIFDDAGQLLPIAVHQGNLSWEVRTQSTWIPLQKKYRVMLTACRPQRDCRTVGYVVWDDDDVYLPWHLEAHAQTLQADAWSHPSQAWSTYDTDPIAGDRPRSKQLNGRHYHGALAVRSDLMAALGGWPDTDRSDYDKQMLAACRAVVGQPGDPCRFGPPSYIYRWADTGRDHISGRIQNGRYPRPRIQEPGTGLQLIPQYDASTRALVTVMATSVK